MKEILIEEKQKRRLKREKRKKIINILKEKICLLLNLCFKFYESVK